MKRLEDIKLVIFDADGTLRECTIPGQVCPNQPGEWRLMDWLSPRIDQMWRVDVPVPHGTVMPRGYLPISRFVVADAVKGPIIAIASNQGGVGLGYMTGQTARQMLRDLWTEIWGWTDPPDEAIMMCPHAPKDGCKCRKPNPGMIIQLMQQYNIHPDDTLYVGDMDSDRHAADAAGCHFMPAMEFFDRCAIDGCKHATIKYFSPGLKRWCGKFCSEHAWERLCKAVDSVGMSND